MKIIKSKFFLALYFLLGCISAIAQTYPVQVSTVVLPPYSVHLSDYTTSEKLAVNVLFNDPTRFELTVKLKVTIEGKNITLSTKPEFNPKPIYLQSGFPERLTGIDLAPYFEPNNLNFQGLDRRAFEQKSALPEGVYRICIEVWEYSQNKKVSNTGCSTVWMILNDPPIINYPKNGSKIKILDPQLVIFNWTPRHTGSPNAAFATEYDFELVEVRSANQNPNNAILTSPPIYTSTTQSTSIYYSIAETPLIPGQQYAFRVRAKAIAGLDELDLFKNKGYSEVFAFTYGDLCLTPDAIHLESITPTSVKATWVSLPAHTSFNIRYKENKEGAEWFEKSSMVPEFTINGLRPETEYAVQVVGVCGVVANEEIKTYNIKTKKVEESNFVCGAAADKIDILNPTLIKSLSPGQFIESSNFKIALIEVSNTGDGFSGRGIAYIPWFKLAGLKVEFKDIQVNEDKKVIKGNVVSTKSANSNWVYTSKDTPGDATDNGSGNGNNTNSGSGNGSDTTGIGTVIVANNPTIIVDSITGNTVITDDKGKVTVVKPGDKVTVVDNDRNETVVTGGSAVAQSGSNSGNNAGSGGTANGGNSGTVENTWSPETGKFGPIQVTYSEAPVTDGKDVKGNCAYKAKGSFDVTLTEGIEISKTIHFADVTIAYTKNCETDKLVGVGFTWQNAAGIDAGKLGVVSVTAHALKLFLTVDGDAKGSVDLKAFLNQDINFSDLTSYETGELDLVVKAGLGGNFSFGFEKNNLIADKISGSWDFSGISKINIDLLKGKDKLAQLKNGKVDAHGIVSGTVTTDYPISYTSEYYKIELDKASIDLQLKIYKSIESWGITGGNIRSQISEIKNVKGEINFDLTYDNAGLKSTSTSTKMSAFGMILSDVKLTTEHDNRLVFKSLVGSFKGKHPEFDVVLNVKRFELTSKGIQEFNMNGEFTYKGQNIKLQETTYDKKLDALVGIASIVSGTGADKKVLSIDGFRIYSDGRIDMGEVTGSFDSGEAFGPLRITMEIPTSKKTDEQGYKIYEDVTCSFLLNLKAGKRSIKEIAIKDAKISYKKHPETGAYKDVHALWEGTLDLGSVGIVSGKMKKFDLKVDEKGALSGTVTLDAYSNADVSVKEFLAPESKSDIDIILKKGIVGNFDFKFSNKPDFSGYWDFNNIKKINGELIKASKVIAQIQDGKINEQFIFTGMLNTVHDISYQNKQAKITLIEIDMGFSVSLEEGKGMETFQVTSGGAKVEVSEMEGMTGSMVFGLSYHTDKTIHGVVVQTEKSKVKAFGMEMKELNLLSIWDTQFNLKEISGKVRLVNESVGYGYFALEEFKVLEGRLITCKGNGKMIYKGFLFDLENINYNSAVSGTSLLTADAKLLWKIGTRLQKVEVDKFEMDAKGDVKIGRLKGSIKANEALFLTFDAAFEEHRFIGSFKAKLGMMEFDGTVDGGSAVDEKKEEYNFGYLGIVSTLDKSGIPIGATGFKLTKLGGKLGLNYKMNLVGVNVTNSAPGNPMNGSYLIGLDLGIADVANLFEVTGSTFVEFGDGKMRFDLSGKLKMPNVGVPIITGDLNVKYLSPEEEMLGKVTAKIKIPASTGKVFQLQNTLDFGYKQKSWFVKGNGTGSLFNAVNFIGAMEFKNNTATSSIPFVGFIDGTISYTKNIKSSSGYHFLSYGVDVNSTLEVGFNQNLRIELTEQGLESDFMVNVHGKAGLEVKGSTNYKIEVSGSAQMKVSYRNEEAKINGLLELEVLTGDKQGEKYETEIDLTL